MINDIDRKSLIDYRLHQANETIDLVKFLLESKKISGCCK